MIIQLFFVLVLLGESHGILAQRNSESNPVWTKEQWEEAKKGIDYTEEEKKKEEKKKDTPADPEAKADDSSDSDSNIGEWLSDFFASPLIKILTIIVIIALLIVTIYFLMRTNGAKDSKLITQQIPDFDNPDEHIEETDLDRFLRLSLEAGDFNTATRILYLKSLQALHIGKLLEWQKDKTNQDYLSEMRSQKNYGDFRELTYIFEVVWYGDQKISETEFAQIKTLFDKFLDTLTVGHK